MALASFAVGSCCRWLAGNGRRPRKSKPSKGPLTRPEPSVLSRSPTAAAVGRVVAECGTVERERAGNSDDQRTEHTLTWTDPKTGLEVRCVGIEYRDFPAVEWVLYVKNTGNKDTPILENSMPGHSTYARRSRRVHGASHPRQRREGQRLRAAHRDRSADRRSHDSFARRADLDGLAQRQPIGRVDADVQRGVRRARRDRGAGMVGSLDRHVPARRRSRGAGSREDGCDASLSASRRAHPQPARAVAVLERRSDRRPEPLAASDSGPLLARGRAANRSPG